MTWLRIDDGFTEHRKVLKLRRSERWTWLEILTYCARQNNGGRIPKAISDVLRHVTNDFLERCVKAGLLDHHEDGYQVHDWLEYNPRDPTGALRQQRYRNATRNGQVTGNVTDENVTNVTPRARTRARVPSPTPTESVKESTSSFLPSPATDRTEGRNFDIPDILKDM